MSQNKLHVLIKKMDILIKEQNEKDKEIKKIEIDPDCEQLCKMFTKSVNLQFQIDNSMKNIMFTCGHYSNKIKSRSFSPDEIWKKVDSQGYDEAKKKFAYDLHYDNKKEFDNCRELIEERNKIGTKLFEIIIQKDIEIMRELLTEEEYKDMHEYIDKEIRPMVLKFYKENDYDVNALNDDGNVNECTSCDTEIYYENVAFNTFNTYECPHCGDRVKPCGICRDVVESYDFCHKCPIDYIMNKRMEKIRKEMIYA